MNKSQLLQHLAEKSGKTPKKCPDFLNLIVETAYAEAKKNGEFGFPGLGKLQKKERAARMGRNPATGATISIPAKTVVTFRMSKAAKDAILA